MVAWFTTKLNAAYETPEFSKKVKGLIHDRLKSYVISVVNISEAAQKTIKKWSVDAVVEEIEDVMSTNADKVVKALKDELHKSPTSVGANEDITANKDFKAAVQNALKLVQDQLNNHDGEIQDLS